MFDGNSFEKIIENNTLKPIVFNEVRVSFEGKYKLKINTITEMMLEPTQNKQMGVLLMLKIIRKRSCLGEL